MVIDLARKNALEALPLFQSVDKGVKAQLIARLGFKFAPTPRECTEKMSTYYNVVGSQASAALISPL